MMMTQEIVVRVVGVLLTGLITFVAAYLRGKMKSAKSLRILQEVEDALLQGMAVAQDEVVRPAKAKTKKLSSDSIKEAELMAVAIARDVATKDAKKVLKDMKSSKVKSMIKGLLK